MSADQATGGYRPSSTGQAAPQTVHHQPSSVQPPVQKITTFEQRTAVLQKAADAQVALALASTRDRFGGDGRDVIVAFLRALNRSGHDAWALKSLADSVERAHG